MEIAKTNLKQLGLFSLVMIAIVSVDSLRNLPIAAQYGFSLITFYLIAAILFFIPLAWVTSKLAVLYPETGGSFIWISNALGNSYGNLGIWLQWIYNIIWCPTIFVFISITLLSVISPELQNNKFYILTISLLSFWAISLFHCRGIHITAWISTVSVVLGTLIPMAILVILAAYWLFSGKPSATPLSVDSLIPTARDMLNISFFSNILFSLLGQEVIAMHAGNVKNPRETYPKAVFISAIVIIVSIIISSSALCVILPADKIGLASGLIDVLETFFAAHGIKNITFLLGGAIILGGLGIASSWMIGLARGVNVSLQRSHAPKWLQAVNKNEMPAGVLIMQALVFSFLLSLFLFFENINSSYWFLSAVTAQFALLYYILLFLSAIKLLLQTETKLINRIYAVVFPLLGITMCLVGILVGFVPPEFISTEERLIYKATMISIFVIITLFSFYRFILRKKNKKSS